MSVEQFKGETDANQARASDPRVCAWVSANAGTGKTTVLVNRVLRLLMHADDASGRHTRPETIVCLTYTKAAAAEMENRLFAILSQWAVMSEPELAGVLKDLRGEPAGTQDMARARTLFARTLDTSGGLKIHTIHAFCERLLHRFPLEAGVQADFKVLEDAERRILRDAAIDAVLGEAAQEPGAPLGQALQEVIAATGEERFREIIDVTLARQQELRAMTLFADGFDSVGEAERHSISLALGAGADNSDAALREQMAGVLSDAQIDTALKEIPSGKAAENRLLEAFAKAKAAPFPELRALALARAFLTNDKKKRKSLLTKPVREALPELAAQIEAAQERFAELARAQAARHIASCTGALLTLADRIIGEYERRKDIRAALDYDDLIVKSVRLLGSSPAAQWVLYKLDYGIDHILVDEAQDTSPLQWKVIGALAGEFFSGAGAQESARTLFAVGDEKQSIYSFQGADPASFATQGAAFKKAARDASRPWEGVPLTVSFRSTESVLGAVDGVFSHQGARDGVSWAGAPIVHHAVRSGQAGLVELWEIEEPEEADEVHPMRPDLETHGGAHGRDRLVERLTGTIRHWLDSGETLAARNRKIRPGDILILVRSRDEFVSKLIRALKARDIPVAGADRMTLREQLAVMDLMAAGDFALMPEDDLNLAVLLKSPLIGFDDDDLFDLAHERPGALWNSLRDRAGDKPRYGDALARLKDWLARADTRPPYEFFAGLLEERQMEMRRALIARLGADAGDAIDEFLNMALDYERLAPPTLQGFLNWMRNGDAQVKRDMEQGRDEVRIMTAHGAKGLEANIVILPDTCKGPSSGGGAKPKLLPLPRASAPPGAPDHLVWAPTGVMKLAAIAEAREKLKQAEREEHNRLLYVAMTRARDRLYVCGWKGAKKPPKECWYNLVSAGLEGLAKPASGPHGERVLRYQSAQTTAPRDRAEIVEEKTSSISLPDWARRNAVHETPASLPLTPSAIAADSAASDETGLRLVEADVVPPLERGDLARFLRGTLIHALLEHLPEIAVAEREARARAFVAARAGALGQGRQEALISETLAVLSDPDFAPLFLPGSQAEAPITARIARKHGPDIELNGQIDRLAVGDDEVLIVDYKTNRPPPRRPEDVAPLYLRQLAAYRAALAILFPDKHIRAALLWTDIPALMPIPDELLDQAAAILKSL